MGSYAAYLEVARGDERFQWVVADRGMPGQLVYWNRHQPTFDYRAKWESVLVRDLSQLRKRVTGFTDRDHSQTARDLGSEWVLREPLVYAMTDGEQHGVATSLKTPYRLLDKFDAIARTKGFQVHRRT